MPVGPGLVARVYWHSSLALQTAFVPLVHALPHAPQLFRSVASSTHPPEQHVDPPAASHDVPSVTSIATHVPSPELLHDVSPVWHAFAIAGVHATPAVQEAGPAGPVAPVAPATPLHRKEVEDTVPSATVTSSPPAGQFELPGLSSTVDTVTGEAPVEPPVGPVAPAGPVGPVGPAGP